jgi:hypothetical protein
MTIDQRKEFLRDPKTLRGKDLELRFEDVHEARRTDDQPLSSLGDVVEETLDEKYMENMCIYIYEIYDNFKECMGNVAKTILYLYIYT